MIGGGDHSRTVAGGEDRCGRDHPVHHPSRRHPTRSPLPRLDHVGSVRPVPRYDVPVPWLLQARRHLRFGPYDRLPGRADVRVEPEMPMPRTSPAQNVLGRTPRLARPTTTRRHRDLDRPHGQIHTTRPGSYPLFPKLCEPTAPVVLSAAQRAAAAEHHTGCGLTMPRRKHTRAQDKARRVIEERKLNENRDDEMGLSRTSVTECDRPPPF